MKRCLFTAALFLVAVGTASADYILIRIDVNKFGIMPAGVGMLGGEGGGPGIPGGGERGPGPGPGGLGGFQGPGGIGGQPGGIGGQPGGEGGGLIPPVPPPTSGGAFGGFPPSQVAPDPNQPGGNQPMMGDDPNAKYISAVVEIKNQKFIAPTPFGFLWSYDHKWSTNKAGNWMPYYSPVFPWVSRDIVRAEPFEKVFNAKFEKEKIDVKNPKLDKNKVIDSLLHLARFSLSRGQLAQFRSVMEEAKKVDSKHPIVKNYVNVDKALAQPFKNDDPAQRDFLQEITKSGYRETVSRKKHFAVYSEALSSDKFVDALIARRLALMEDTLEAFYYWFAVQRESALQPNLPKYRLNAILASSKEEFKIRHAQWGSPAMVADGFTPRRDNLIVMSAKVRLTDPLFQEFDEIFTKKMDDANATLERMFRITLTRDELLNGNLSDLKKTPAAGNAAIFVAAAQTAAILHKTLEDDAERYTVTHETARQLLIASEMFPRNVEVPEWVLEGLASLFETPAGSIYPTIGGPSWKHAISFRHLRKTKFGPPTAASDVLMNVVTDDYFQDARQASRESLEQLGNADLQRRANDSWELARCTAWSYVYYLAQKGKLDNVFAYGKELDKLPRDMDLNDQILQSCYGKAFNLADARDAARLDDIKLQNEANRWFDLMQTVNLEPTVQAYYAQLRSNQDPPPAPPPSNGGTTSSPGNSGKTPPNPPVNPEPPPPQPMPPEQKQPQGPGLDGTAWSGNETLIGYGALSFQFQAGGQAVMVDKDGNTPGNWNQDGNNVTLTFGPVTYTGTIAGTTMQGSATNGKDNWKFTVNRRAGAPVGPGPGANPGGVRPPNPGGVRPPGPMPIRPPGGYRPPGRP